MATERNSCICLPGDPESHRKTCPDYKAKPIIEDGQTVHGCYFSMAGDWSCQRTSLSYQVSPSPAHCPGCGNPCTEEAR